MVSGSAFICRLVLISLVWVVWDGNLMNVKGIFWLNLTTKVSSNSLDKPFSPSLHLPRVNFDGRWIPDATVVQPE